MLSPERQSARMSKITNDCLTRSGMLWSSALFSCCVLVFTDNFLPVFKIFIRFLLSSSRYIRRIACLICCLLYRLNVHSLWLSYTVLRSCTLQQEVSFKTLFTGWRWKRWNMLARNMMHMYVPHFSAPPCSMKSY